jgi:hypothetical protein
MFRCERCGTGFHPTRSVLAEDCPRCLRRDGVASPLVFRLFEPSGASGVANEVDEEAKPRQVVPLEAPRQR